MEQLTLKDIAIINMGQSPDSKTYNEEKNGIPFYQGKSDFGKINPIPRVWCSNPIKIAEKDDILISVRAPIGDTNIATEKCCIGRGLAYIRPIDESINLKYLYYLINSKYNELNKYGTGSTFKAITKDNLCNLKCNSIPDIEEQTIIANRLDNVSQIIEIKKEQIENLNSIIKSQFVEMFGDPTINQKGFPVEKIEDVIDFQGGSQPDKKYFEYNATDENIRLIQIRDYKTDDYITYIPKKLAKRFCEEDDIMIGRYGPPIFQILQGIKGAYNVALMKAIPKKGNKEFIRCFLKQDCLLQYLEGLSQRTAGQAGIEMPKLKKYPFPYPPIELQNKFVEIVKQIDKQKIEIQTSLEETQKLQESLMNMYFGGY